MGYEATFLGIAVLLFIILINIIVRLQSNITAMKSTLDKIAKHMGVDDLGVENIDDELKSLILEGKKVKAIKRYRMITGLGLKESHEYVHRLSYEMKLKK